MGHPMVIHNSSKPQSSSPYFLLKPGPGETKECEKETRGFSPKREEECGVDKNSNARDANDKTKREAHHKHWKGFKSA